MLKGKVRIESISKEDTRRIVRLVPQNDETIAQESRIWGREVPGPFEVNLIASPEVNSLVVGSDFYLELTPARKGAAAG